MLRVSAAAWAGLLGGLWIDGPWPLLHALARCAVVRWCRDMHGMARYEPSAAASGGRRTWVQQSTCARAHSGSGGAGRQPGGVRSWSRGMAVTVICGRPAGAQQLCGGPWLGISQAGRPAWILAEHQSAAWPHARRCWTRGAACSGRQTNGSGWLAVAGMGKRSTLWLAGRLRSGGNAATVQQQPGWLAGCARAATQPQGSSSRCARRALPPAVSWQSCAAGSLRRPMWPAACCSAATAGAACSASERQPAGFSDQLNLGLHC